MTDTWDPRLNIAEALEADGWTGDPGDVQRKNGAVWSTVNDSGDSQLTGPGHWNAEFPSDVPAVVVIAACLAATHPTT